MRRAGALTGIIGPPLFFGVVILEGAVRPGYRPVHDAISELSLGPRGWIQTTNFLVFGVLFLIFAVGVKASLGRSGAARLGGSLLIVIGAGVLGCGLFRAEHWPPSSMSTAGRLHLFCALVLVFAMLPVVTAVLARAFAADPRWRSLARATLLTSFVTTVLLVGGLALMNPPGRPARIGNEYLGLIQRTDVAVFLFWQMAVAHRIWRRLGE